MCVTWQVGKANYLSYDLYDLCRVCLTLITSNCCLRNKAGHEIVDIVLCKRLKLCNTEEMLDYILHEQDLCENKILSPLKSSWRRA